MQAAGTPLTLPFPNLLLVYITLWPPQSCLGCGWRLSHPLICCGNGHQPLPRCPAAHMLALYGLVSQKLGLESGEGLGPPLLPPGSGDQARVSKDRLLDILASFP